MKTDQAETAPVLENLNSNTVPATGLANFQQQISECLSDHESCPKPLRYSFNRQNEFPLRLLDVSASHGDTCFVVLGELTDEPYVTLSYVWGLGPNLKTSRENVVTHMEKGISLSQLPRTIQDAILVTRAYHVRYLWVDALCIVQDDVDEWQVEARKMSSIYMGSFVTIAATNAEASSDGFICNFSTNLDKEIASPNEYMYPFNEGHEDWRTINLGEKVQHLQAKAIQRSTWQKRGWTLQERLLSSRILYYTNLGVLFDCLGATEQNIKQQTSPLGRRATGFNYQIRDFRCSPVVSDLVQTWRELMTDYTQRSLTRQTDILVALQGLAEFSYQRTAYELVYGHLNFEFSTQLCWVSRNFQAKKTNLAPSWAWSSMQEGHCAWLRSLADLEDWTDSDYSLVRSSNLSVDHQRNLRLLRPGIYSDPTSHVLLVRQPLIQTRLEELWKDHYKCIGGTNKIENHELWIFLDQRGSSDLLLDDLWILVMDRPSSSRFVLCLQLVRQPCYFARIGIAYLKSPSNRESEVAIFTTDAPEEFIII